MPITIVALNKQITILSAAITKAADKGRTTLSDVRTQKGVLAGMLRTFAQYANTTTTDETAILSTGLTLSKVPVKNQPPDAIKKIVAKFTGITGTIKLQWSRSKRAKYYNVFMSTDAGVTWTLYKVVFDRTLTADSLTSDKRYTFKVVPVGLHGNGPESAIVSQLAS